ncbi:MAG: hypothetical protein R3246_12595 [Acidimicrobiia bacterium]|nr:hypothetical protein [Acidimicrobiia bacterium]
MHVTLNFVHVASAFVWAGGALFLTLFVGRAAQAAGPGAGPFMGALLTRTPLVDVMMWASLLTVGSGLWLWFLDFGGGMPSGWRGVVLSIGALAGISALALGLLRQRPTTLAMRQLALEMGGNPPTEVQAARMGELRAKMTNYGNVLAILVAVAITGMSLGA